MGSPKLEQLVCADCGQTRTVRVDSAHRRPERCQACNYKRKGQASWRASAPHGKKP